MSRKSNRVIYTLEGRKKTKIPFIPETQRDVLRLKAKLN